jgi:hypothetical protein
LTIPVLDIAPSHDRPSSYAPDLTTALLRRISVLHADYAVWRSGESWGQSHRHSTHRSLCGCRSQWTRPNRIRNLRVAGTFLFRLAMLTVDKGLCGERPDYYLSTGRHVLRSSLEARLFSVLLDVSRDTISSLAIRQTRSGIADIAGPRGSLSCFVASPGRSWFRNDCPAHSISRLSVDVVRHIYACLSKKYPRLPL